jgi:aminopeptidase N
MTLTRWLACLALLLAAPLATAEARVDFDATPGRLPKDVVPLEYTLRIVPDLPARTFRGVQTIRLEVRRPTSTLVMNALNLEIDSARLAGARRSPCTAGGSAGGQGKSADHVRAAPAPGARPLRARNGLIQEHTPCLG